MVSSPSFDLARLLAFPARNATPAYQTPPSGPLWLFEAGLPDPELFPVDALVRLSERVLRDEHAEALQYGGAPGNAIAAGNVQLRDVLARRTTELEGRAVDRDHIMLTTGSAQALMLLFEAFVDPGDAVAIDSPTWNAVIAALDRRGADIVSLPLDDEGIDLGVLEQELARLASEGRRLKLVYTIATFNTPTGVSLSLRRRRRLIELAEHWDFVVIEDNVYRPLRYDGEPLPTMFSLDTSDRVVKVDSFSKVMAPGLRLGWLTAHPAVMAAVAGIRGDLGVSQWIARTVARFIDEGLLDTHVAAMNLVYRAKRDAAEAALHRHCDPWVRWRTPEGGFFLWVGIDDALDAGEVMRRALTGGVLVRAGEKFFASGNAGHQYFRLAFPAVPIAEIERGMAVLGEAIRAVAR